MRAVICRLVMVWAFCMQLAIADDDVYLTSGDHLKGEVIEINREYIVIDTVFAKQLNIKHKLIAKLMTEAEINVVFNDGKILKSKLIKISDDAIYYQVENKNLPLDIEQIAVNPSQVIAENTPEQDNVKYSGNFDVGLSKTSGNEDEQDYYGALVAQARTLKNRYTLEASKTVEKNEGDKTQDETFGSLQYDRFFNEKWYAFTSASFEEDLEELLNLRSTYSLGSGYQFFDDDSLKLKAELGFAYVDEDFEEDDDVHYSGGRWAIDYEHALLSWLGLYHSHEGFFSLENSDDITMRSSSGFKFPLNNYINAKLEANVDWNRSPAEGATGTDKEYIFTLGYEF